MKIRLLFLRFFHKAFRLPRPRLPLIQQRWPAPYFLTEKPLDSILSGCLPIIWGHPGTKQWEKFDINGMLFFENETQLLNLIGSGTLNEEFYNSKLDSIFSLLLIFILFLFVMMVI